MEPREHVAVGAGEEALNRLSMRLADERDVAEKWWGEKWGWGVQALEECLEGRYGVACEHAHSCCILLARRARFFRHGTWHTWIDYDRFHVRLCPRLPACPAPPRLAFPFPCPALPFSACPALPPPRLGPRKRAGV